VSHDQEGMAGGIAEGIMNYKDHIEGYAARS
jgi:hypothetical protein